jgi:glycosyltransferase involved in cell wall biosynthesis
MSMDQLDKIKNKIRTLLNENNIQGARKVFEILNGKKNIKLDADLASILSVLFIKEENYKQAESVLVKGLEYAPFDQDLLFNLAYVYELKGDYLEARYHYNDVLIIGDNEAVREAEEAITRLDALDQKSELNKGNFAFFVKEGLDSFAQPILNAMSDKFRVKKIIVKNLNQIDLGMKWADTCWFEWCDELVIYGSHNKRRDNQSIVCRLHSYEAFTNYVDRVNWENIDKLIFVANHIQRFVLEQSLALPSEKTVVIPNGLDLEQYSFKSSKPGFNIAFVGYINYKKGPMLLFHAFKEIFDFDNRYKLFIAGKFQDKRDVLYFKHIIKEMGLQDNIIFEGWQNNINEWLEDKNYIISSSLLESQHLSIMEAMAKGIKPLIHNYYGANEVYKKDFLWTTSKDLVNLITKDTYDSRVYRDFISTYYNQKDINEKLRNLFI